MTEERISFTIRRLEGLPLPEKGKRCDYYDADVRNLLIQVTGAGSKTFYVRRKVDGVSSRILIGRFPEVTVEAARKKAREYLGAIELGAHPHEAKRKHRQEETLGELFDLYISNYAQHRCNTWKDMQENFRRYLSKWKDRKISSIKRQDVQAWVNQLGDNVGAHTANRNYDNLRALYSWAIKRGYFSKDNPCLGIDKFKMKARERFIQPDEFERFFAALKTEASVTVQDYVYLSLLTAARKANVMAMRWDQIDFDLETWYIPETKNGESQTIPLTEQAVKILDRRKDGSDSEWVFPAEDSTTGHMVSPNKAFKKVLTQAGLTDLRLHDLRRTMGSYLAIQGTSPTIIGKALGHRSQASTAIYARLTNDPVRQALENAQQFIWTVSGLTKSPKVVRMSKRKKPTAEKSTGKKSTDKKTGRTKR